MCIITKKNRYECEKKKNKYTKHGDVTQILGRKSIILELSRERLRINLCMKRP